MPTYEQTAFQNLARQGRLEDITPQMWETLGAGTAKRVEALLGALKSDAPTDPLTGRKVIPRETGGGIALSEILNLLKQWSPEKSDEDQAKQFAQQWKKDWEASRAGPITFGTTGVGGIGGIPTPEQASAALKSVAPYLQSTLTPSAFQSYAAAQPTGEASVENRYAKAYDQWRKGEISSEQLMAIGRGESPMASPSSPPSTPSFALPSAPFPADRSSASRYARVPGMVAQDVPTEMRPSDWIGPWQPGMFRGPAYSTPPTPTQPTQPAGTGPPPGVHFDNIIAMQSGASPPSTGAASRPPPLPAQRSGFVSPVDITEMLGGESLSKTPLPANLNANYWLQPETNPFEEFRKKGIQI